MNAMFLWVFGWGVRSKKLEIEMTLLSMVHQNDVDADGKDDSSDVFPKVKSSKMWILDQFWAILTVFWVSGLGVRSKKAGNIEHGASN